MYDKTATLELLDQAVAERGPNWVYPDEGLRDTEWRNSAAGCLYRKQGTNEPACIVGVVLNKLDLLDRTEEGEVVDNLPLEDVFTPGAIQLLTVTQMKQDAGRPWGQAVREAYEFDSKVTDDGEFIYD